MLLENALKATSSTITALGWVERYGGVSFPYKMDVSDGEKPLYKTIPATASLNSDCIQRGNYKQLFPDQRYRNLLYWEVKSELRPANKQHPKGAGFSGSARLVYWLNLPKMGLNEDASLVEVILANALIGRKMPVMDGMALELSSPTFAVKDARRIFPYDYGRAHDAFMLKPFSFGAIDFIANVQITPACLPDLVQGMPIKCIVL